MRETKKSFDDSLRKSQQDLQPIKPLLQQMTFHLTGNSHIDAAWLWPWTETVDVVRRTFSTALQLMDEYPTYHLYPIRPAIQRVDGGKVPGNEC